MDAIATGSCLMMPSVMPDSREPVPTSSGFAITRRGGPRNVAATRAAGEEGCRVHKPSRRRGCGSPQRSMPTIIPLDSSLFHYMSCHVLHTCNPSGTKPFVTCRNLTRVQKASLLYPTSNGHRNAPIRRLLGKRSPGAPIAHSNIQAYILDNQ